MCMQVYAYVYVHIFIEIKFSLVTKKGGVSSMVNGVCIPL